MGELSVRGETKNGGILGDSCQSDNSSIHSELPDELSNLSRCFCGINRIFLLSFSHDLLSTSDPKLLESRISGRFCRLGNQRISEPVSRFWRDSFQGFIKLRNSSRSKLLHVSSLQSRTFLRDSATESRSGASSQCRNLRIKILTKGRSIFLSKRLKRTACRKPLIEVVVYKSLFVCSIKTKKGL